MNSDLMSGLTTEPCVTADAVPARQRRSSAIVVLYSFLMQFSLSYCYVTQSIIARSNKIGYDKMG